MESRGATQSGRCLPPCPDRWNREDIHRQNRRKEKTDVGGKDPWLLPSPPARPELQSWGKGWGGEGRGEDLAGTPSQVGAGGMPSWLAPGGHTWAMRLAAKLLDCGDQRPGGHPHFPPSLSMLPIVTSSFLVLFPPSIPFSRLSPSGLFFYSVFPFLLYFSPFHLKNVLSLFPASFLLGVLPGSLPSFRVISYCRRARSSKPAVPLLTPRVHTGV